MDRVDQAWLAGLFEGEGYIGISPQGYVTLSIGMNDIDVIQRVDAIFPSPCHVWIRPPRRQTHSTHYVWRLARGDLVTEFLLAILPFLGARRRARAEEALAAIRSQPGNGSYHRRKTHCPKGHPYSGENLLVLPNQERACRECRRERSREYHRRRSGYYERHPEVTPGSR